MPSRLQEWIRRADERLFHCVFAEGESVDLMIVGCLGTGENDKHMQASLRAMSESSPGLVANIGDLGYTGVGLAIKNLLRGRSGFIDDGISDGYQLHAQLIAPADKENLKNTLFLLTVGNHELNIHGVRFIKLALLTWSFLFTRRPALAANYAAVQQGALNLRNLEGFIGIGEDHFMHEPLNPQVKLNDGSTERKFQMMKNGYYRLRSRKTGAGLATVNLETFFLNTCTLPYDLEQIQWVIDAINESPAVHIIIACHHPIEASTVGKRRFNSNDGLMYAEANCALHPEKISEIKWRYRQLVALSRGPGHCDLLAYVWAQEILPKLSIEKRRLIRALFVAHDHFTAVSIGEHGIPQFVVGGGGGDKLNKPKYSRLDPRCIYAKKETGIAKVVIQDDAVLVSIFAGHPDSSETMDCRLSRCEVTLTQPMEDNSHSLEMIYTSHSFPDAGAHHRIRYRPQGENGYFIERAERLLPQDPYQIMTTSAHTDEQRTQPLVPQLCAQLQDKLTQLAGHLGLAAKTPIAIRGECDTNLRFKQLFDLLSSCRIFMYRLNQFHAKSLGNGDRVESILRTLLACIKVINDAIQENSQLRNFVLTSNQTIDCHQQLKKINKKFSSNQLTVFDVIGGITLFLIAAAMIRCLFFSGDFAQKPKPITHSLANTIGYSVLTAAVLWLVQGVGRWKFRPKFENNFGVQLKKFVNEVMDSLEALQEPVVEHDNTYGTFNPA